MPACIAAASTSHAATRGVRWARHRLYTRGSLLARLNRWASAHGALCMQRPQKRKNTKLCEVDQRPKKNQKGVCHAAIKVLRLVQNFGPPHFQLPKALKGHLILIKACGCGKRTENRPPVRGQCPFLSEHIPFLLPRCLTAGAHQLPSIVAAGAVVVHLCADVGARHIAWTVGRNWQDGWRSQFPKKLYLLHGHTVAVLGVSSRSP